MQTIWKDITQSLRFEFVKTGVGVVEDSPWRRAGFTRPYHIVINIRRGGLLMALGHDAKSWVLREGDWAYIPAGMWRRNAPSTSHATTTVRFCNFRFQVYEQVDFLSFFDLPVRLDEGRQLEELIDILQDLSNEETSDELVEAITLRATGLRLLAELLRKASPKPTLGKFLSCGNRFADVFDFISHNIHRPITLDDLASIACLSVSAFHRSFRDMTGVSPLRFVRERRIDEAKRLLITTDKPLADIADDLGYSDAFAFSKSFKKTCGQTKQEGIDF